MGGYVCRNVHRGLRSRRRIACFNISAIPPFVHAAGMIRFLRRNSLSLAAHSIGQLVPGGFAMFRRAAILTVVCGVAFGTFGARSLHAQSSSAQDPPAAPSPVSKVPKPPVPAYHAGPPKDPLPDTLDPAQFSDAETRNIFTLGGKSETGPLSATLLLRLRQRSGAQEPARLLHRLSRSALRSL